MKRKYYTYIGSIKDISDEVASNGPFNDKFLFSLEGKKYPS